ncbi:MAG: transglycosylase SLT domain-containing protein [Pseudomonadota bacterium]
MIYKILRASAIAILVTGSASADTLTEQRSAFKRAYELARAGNASTLPDAQATLGDYTLWPDLVSAHYLGRLRQSRHADIEGHLQSYPDTALNRTLRHRYATHLARTGGDAAFLALYDAHYAESGDTKLDCHAADLRLQNANTIEHRREAMALWMVGRSQPKACDPLFARLRSAELLTDRRHAERLELALTAGEFKLAQYLAKRAPEGQKVWVSRWRTMRQDPSRALQRIGRVPRHPLRDALYTQGIRRLARRNPQSAYALLAKTAEDSELTTAQLQSLLDYVAVRGARKGVADVDDWSEELTAPSEELLQWRVRATIARGDWAATLANIDAMPDTLAAESPWRYFRARALEIIGRPDDARALYQALSTERSYYGFMAADRLEADYNFAHSAVAEDRSLQDVIIARPAIVRARELHAVGQFGLARSEWERAVRPLPLEERQQAALLADDWGWHSQAIRTLAYSGGRDDLIRTYPTPYKADYDEHTTKASIARTWAMSVSRAESLFMSDVKSSAGAVGLMQLLPSTGKQTARRAGVRYRGLSTLLNPTTNITLGVHYLGQMYSRFDQNQVLATAAYNAGPRRVRSWLPEGESVDADVWIETIPFTETRRYVKKVLFADTVFHWRLTGSERRLASRMPAIQPRD